MKLEYLNIKSNIKISAAGREIHITGAVPGEVFMLDEFGKIVQQQKMPQSGKLTIPPKIKSGDYVVMVKSGEEFNTKKVIIGS